MIRQGVQGVLATQQRFSVLQRTQARGFKGNFGTLKQKTGCPRHPTLTQQAFWALSDALVRVATTSTSSTYSENTFLLDDAGVYCNGVVAVE